MRFETVASAIQWLKQEQMNDITLELRDNNINATGATSLAEALKTNTFLTTLNLRFNNIDATGATSLAEALKIKTSLTTLNLWGNIIGDEGATSLVEALKTNTFLTTLSLGYNNIGDTGVVSLAEALKANTSLTKLELGYNNIGDKGATSLAKALKANTSLTTLNLQKNNIDATGATSLAKALKANTSLTTLNLWGNNIGATGATSLAEALKINTSLTTLDLWNNNIGDKGAISLAEALKINTSLTTLNLEKNNIGDEGIQAIIQALQDNFFITTIDGINNRTIGTLLTRNEAAQAKFETILSSLTRAEQIESPDEALASYEAIRDQLAAEANNYPPLFIQKYSAPFYISLGKKYHHYGLVEEALNCFYQAYPFIGADIRLMMMESMLIQTHSSDTSLDDLCLLWLLAQGLPFVLRQQSPLTIVIRMFNQLSEGKIVIHERALANKERLFGLFDERRKTNKQDGVMRLIEENPSIILKK